MIYIIANPFLIVYNLDLLPSNPKEVVLSVFQKKITSCVLRET